MNYEYKRTSEKEELFYYKNIMSAADKVYGEHILTDEGTGSELARYTLNDEADKKENFQQDSTRVYLL
ncbi:MAG: hypothetical protein K6B41_10510 [Butyrivibrio sp.]|nr:hypothetical protein [Butyrivibrio sp.]